MATPSQLVGQILGHYRILEQIGAGGMGVVYRAHDERLDRDVALKVLPPGVLADETARKRLRKEALTLSKLNHANIAIVHDFDAQDGVDFLVMEYVSGITLAEKLAKGPLPEREALALGEQVAKTLQDAHELGIVHRDLKPGNIMVTPKGQVKLLDFGLAKMLRSAETDVTKSLTGAGDAAGTQPYMAPEQLRGESVDFRTDIYALGTVLYEMVTNRRPFEAKLSTTLTDDILHKTPCPPGRLSPSLSPKLEDIILKCLEKGPENRYQSAEELVVDLRRLANPSTAAPVAARGQRSRIVPASAILLVVVIAAVLLGLRVGALRQLFRRQPAATSIRSLGVLPLDNLSHYPEQEYFADGMTDALTTEMAQIGALRVISRTSAMQYKGAKKPLPQIARELNVDAIIEGSVLRSAGKVRVTTQLIQASPEQHLWAKSYESDLRDILTLQSQVARSVSDEIRIKLTEQQESRLQKPRVVNPQAHDAYLRGRYYRNRSKPADIEKARGYFEEAIHDDPQYAPAYSGLADYYSVLPFYSNSSPDDVFPKAKAAVAKALELDDSLAEAHASLAYIRTYYDWDWVDAEREFQRALVLNPNDATVHRRYSRYLSSLGRIDAALEEIRRAQLLDPLATPIRANVGMIYYFGHQYDSAIEQLKNLVKEDQKSWVAHWGLGLAYEQKGLIPKAIMEFETSAKLSERSTNVIASLGHAYGIGGRRREAGVILGELEERAKQTNVSGYQIALVFAGLGDKDRSLEALEKAFREHSTLLTYLKMDPRFDPLRSKPRLRDLMRRVGLPQ